MAYVHEVSFFIAPEQAVEADYGPALRRAICRRDR